MPPPQKRVVAIGGGTGLSTLLRGLKRYVSHPTVSVDTHCDEDPCRISHLAAIVTVTDDGGSSGRLRDDLNILPPGDIRNCMTALSEDEHLLTRLFQFRFPDAAPGENASDLAGHSFGNLFLAAMSQVTGDFAQAVQASSQILAIRGNIYPATNANVTLSAQMDDGTLVHGETNITRSQRSIVELLLDPPDAPPLPETLEALAKADLITLGPGSLYTSLVTNLLVRGIPQAIANSSATRAYVCNLMTQANESLGLTASQHLERLFAHAGNERIFDYALVNTAPISPELLARYASEGQTPITPDLDAIRALGVIPIPGDYIHTGPGSDSVLRHDYDRVAATLLDLPERQGQTA
ncbi:gluconeogenesis factor YvcK family protein [Terriglobus saanensis]|uniref:Putative gluconeogenesis factor n=1 Tax=Terriglobus saanensis (strain ATCC BAA-1853 / DSM 23119 / SP1PR4) TaxID=401053 RepID=E8V056_TERSS|nr:gluconeogenesis factor YvcK family protein [Terriglobus saanensis]ADV82211.1 protein of unknown function UPF0052 and CofD [Terriglobus saanensis SP1PR4]